MLNTIRPRFATICLAASFLASLVFASDRVATANEEPTQNSQPDKSQNDDQKQSSDTSDQKKDVSRDEGTEKTRDEPRPQEQSQQGELPLPPPPQDPPNRSPNDSRRSPLRYNTPDARGSWDAAGGQQGASLGISIVAADNGRGLNVTRVRPKTAAEQMGIRAGDRIIRLNGEEVRGVDDFVSRIRKSEIGREISIELERNNERLSVRGQLQPHEQPATQSAAPSGSDEYRNYQEIIKRGGFNADEPRRTEPLPTGTERTDPFARDAKPSSRRDPDRGENRQTSFEDRGNSGRQPAGDVESRLARIEDQLERISQDLAELSKAIGSPRATSGLRETASAEFRATNQPQRTPTRPTNELQQTGRQIRQNDRWSAPIDNRFQQGDLPAARERASQEAARRRANQTGAQLQQQERERAAQSRQRAQLPQTEQPPPDPARGSNLPGTQPPLTDTPQSR